MKNCGFAIWGLANLRKLRSCDSGMSPRICRFAELKKKVIMPTFAEELREYTALISKLSEKYNVEVPSFF
jgi:hypothetical protein